MVNFAHPSPGQARASARSDAGALLMSHPASQEPWILSFPHQPPFPLLSSLWADILRKCSIESEVVLFSSSVFAGWVTDPGPKSCGPSCVVLCLRSPWGPPSWVPLPAPQHPGACWLHRGSRSCISLVQEELYLCSESLYNLMHSPSASERSRTQN